MKRFFSKRSVLDEREMMDMYRVEHAGLWSMYALLCVAIVVQLLFGAPMRQMAGELTVLLLVSAGMIVAYARKGIWDDRSRPSTRGNAVYSAVCGMGVALVVLIVRGSILWGLVSGAAMFALCFALLTLMMTLLKRRQSREAQALEENDEIDS